VARSISGDMADVDEPVAEESEKEVGVRPRLDTVVSSSCSLSLGMAIEGATSTLGFTAPVSRS